MIIVKNINKIKKAFNLTRGRLDTVKRIDTENYTILVNDFMFCKTTKDRADKITNTEYSGNLKNDILTTCNGLDIFLDTCTSTNVIYLNRLILKSEGNLLAVSIDYKDFFKTFQRINEKHDKLQNKTMQGNILYSEGFWYGRASLSSGVMADLYDIMDSIKNLDLIK